MAVNPKKSLCLKNRTNYFNPETCRTHVRFSSPLSYQSRSIRIEGYESRLYWQFKYCQDHDGQTFFYTLTYNDKSIPRCYGQVCFDYQHLRGLVVGGFQKVLLRKYGTKFKYFISAELGDGKGQRGFHNNPHYHVLFFLESAKSLLFPYVRISPEDFRHLIRLYWQGFDEDPQYDGWHDYRDAQYGIATEGDNLGLVSDYRAVKYVAKYVCKDINLKKFEKELEHKLRSFYMEKFSPDFFNMEKSVSDEEDYSFSYRDFIEAKVKESINEYRNRYCNKVRVSHGVGDYALQFIDDLMNPTIQFPDKDGFKNRPISMYYYRKLYTDVVKDVDGHNLYVLNDLGLAYKSHNLAKQIRKKTFEAQEDFSSIVENRSLYNKMVSSDVNTDVFMSFDEFRQLSSELISKTPINKICQRYAEYKLVYQDRYFKAKRTGDSLSLGYPSLDPCTDYERFLVPSFFTIGSSDSRLDSFLKGNFKDWFSYDSHPDFLCYTEFFRVLDLCADYFFVQNDDKAQKEAERIANVKRFHTVRKMKSYFHNKLTPILCS